MAWINFLERLLISVIRIGQMYGPWQDNWDTIPDNNSLYIDELGTIVLTKPECEILIT